MTSPMMTPLPQHGFRRTPWKNGGGVTVNFADACHPGVAPDSWNGMIWRFGRTAIVVSAPFSDLAGYERMQLVVEGAGLVLETPDGEIDLRTPFQPVRYDGGTPIVSRLENGPVEVVNLITDRELCDIDMAVAGAGHRTQLAAGTHILYAPDGAVAGSCGDAPFSVAAGDALRLDTQAALSLRIDAGKGVLASIQPKRAKT